MRWRSRFLFHQNSNVIVLGLAFISALAVACQSGGTTVNNVTAVVVQADDSGCTPKNIETTQGNLMKVVLKNKVKNS